MGQRGERKAFISNSKECKNNRLGGGHRREETVMTRLRLGHGALNKSLKMIGKHETGLCEWCQEEESVEHIIIRCRGTESDNEE